MDALDEHLSAHPSSVEGLQQSALHVIAEIATGRLFAMRFIYSTQDGSADTERGLLLEAAVMWA